MGEMQLSLARSNINSNPLTAGGGGGMRDSNDSLIVKTKSEEDEDELSFMKKLKRFEMKVVDFERPGRPAVLRVKEVPKPIIRNKETLIIQVAAAGLNIYDTWHRKGIPCYLYDLSRYLGYECSGKVVAVGSAVFKFKEGDEVCAILELGGGYAEFVVVPESHVLRIPSCVSLVDAAALPLASQLAVYALSILTNVTAGKIVLMHGAAGGIGTIALQYAKHVGCEVFAVEGKEEELHLCKTLGAKVCINYKEQDFCKCAKAETGEKGVDIILDLSGRDHFQKNLDCLTRGGSLVIFGHKIGSQVNVDLSVIVEKDINVVGGDLHRLGFLERKSHQFDVAAKIWPLIEAGHIQPVIGKIFSFSEVWEAHRALEECSIPGKLLLVPGEAASFHEIPSNMFVNYFCHFSTCGAAV